ncbi:hypothetical protein DFJ58DRAFT_744581 [Suillus subalutaceus]|uniref:uncharacterized protein n=1 Tax=Suillus subalutaceus TaxID=48586 RepID=UPI001B8755D9|nr:uncharacterized protein DFJ58DRAFT_744581 [Suillus subalutaceus]KAG1860185.1 hypothetical protein DFJ58DRAFT_744581 [Suillus subalutaceus]
MVDYRLPNPQLTPSKYLSFFLYIYLVLIFHLLLISIFTMSASAATSTTAPAFNCQLEVVETASMLALQAPSADDPFDLLEAWGRDIALFFTCLRTKDRNKVLLTVTEVSNLLRTFQDRLDVCRHIPWLSWGRRRLPLTVEASTASLRTFVALSRPQQSPPAVARLVTPPEPSNSSKGKGRTMLPAADHSSGVFPSPTVTNDNDNIKESMNSAAAGASDSELNGKHPVRRTSQVKHRREHAPQVAAITVLPNAPDSLSSDCDSRSRK